MSELTENIIGFNKLTPQKQRLVETLLKVLSEENGGIWKQGWKSASKPVSATTGKEYRGTNRLFLSLVAMVCGYGVYDKEYNRYKFLIHDYFIAKSIDKVKPNGIVAVITSKGTLDKQNRREELLIPPPAFF